MCPFCIATAALIAGQVTSTGGLAAIAMKKLAGRTPLSNAIPLQPIRLQEETRMASRRAQRRALICQRP